MIISILTGIHILVCIFLVIIVLLQQGKGADMGATFGGSSQTVFGSEGPLPLLNKVTTGAAVVFMLTSLSLAYLSSNLGRGSVMHTVKPPPPPVGGALERSPSSVPLPAGQTAGQSETAPKQFPGKAKQTQPPAKEQKPATSAPAPAQSSAAAPAKQVAPTAKTPAPAEKQSKTSAAPQQPAGETKK